MARESKLCNSPDRRLHRLHVDNYIVVCLYKNVVLGRYGDGFAQKKKSTSFELNLHFRCRLSRFWIMMHPNMYIAEVSTSVMDVYRCWTLGYRASTRAWTSLCLQPSQAPKNAGRAKSSQCFRGKHLQLMSRVRSGQDTSLHVGRVPHRTFAKARA